MANEFVARNGIIAQNNSTITGSLTVTNGITGTISGTASYSNNADLLDGLDSTVFTPTASFTAFSSSLNSFTSSATARFVGLEAATSSLNSYTSSNNANITSLNSYTSSATARFVGLETATASFSGRVGGLEAATASLNTYTSSATARFVGLETYTSSINAKTGSFATTGSNIFIGTQTLTGSIVQSGSFTTTGTIIAQTINVQQVTSSIVYSCGSNNFGTAIGNAQVFTGSMFITGSNIVANVGNACFAGNICSNGNVLVGGTGTTNYLPKFTGASTIGNSQIFDNGTNVGIGTATPIEKLDVRGNIYTNATNTNIYLDNGGAGGASLKIGVTGSTSTYINSLDAHPIIFSTTNTERMRLTASGNLGLGVTPSAWNTVQPVFQIGYTAFSAYQNTQAIYSSNGVYTSGWKYLSNTNATYYSQNEAGPGIHAWFNAPSGTAGNAISFTQAMTLNASGNLSIGNTNDTYKLDVTGTGRFTGVTYFTGGNIQVLNSNASGYSVTTYASTGTSGRSFDIGVGGSTSAQPNRFYIYDNGADALRFYIDSTGAATFSSSVTANNFYSIGTTGFWSDAYDVRRNGFYADGTNLIFRAGTSGTGEQTRMVIAQATGNVGIGTTSPGAALEVKGFGTTNFASGKGNLFISPGGTACQGAGCGGTLTFGTWLNGDLSVPYRIAAIRGISESSTSNNNKGALIFGTATTDDSVNICEQMRITSGGNVGIGTTSPTNKLTVQSNSTQLRLETASDPSGYYSSIESNYNAANPLNIYSSAAASNVLGTIVLSGISGVNTYVNSYYGLVFGTGGGSMSSGTVRMMINGTGNVGIGTTCLSTEANLYLGAQGTSEGGQLVLQKGTSCNCATHLDNYQDRFRIMSGTNATSTTELFSISMNGGDATTYGRLSTIKQGGGGNYKQTVVGQTTAASSGVAKKIAYVGYTHSVRVYIWANQSTAHGSSAIADIVTLYGSSVGGTTAEANFGNVSDIVVTYDNGGSPAYTINVSLTYSGAAPTINYVIEGINHDNNIYTL